MDNLTHTLAGLLVAETAIAFAGRSGQPISARARRVSLIASAVANNIPDADFVYAWITPGKLGYLLHHRGHTHTLLVGLLLGFACFWLSARVLERRSTKGAPNSTPLERRLLLGMCLLGPALHIALDATNNYGVHPFWPLYSGWLYGDAVFIVEPWLWIVTLPALIASARSTIARWVWISILLAGLALAWAFPGVLAITAVALTLSALALGLAAFQLDAVGRWRAAALGWLLVTAVFFAGSRLARATLLDALAVEPRAGSRTTLEVVVTPLVANPFCYSTIAIEVTDKDYRLSLARVSLLPSLIDARRCSSEHQTITAKLGSAGLPSARVAWQGRFEGSLERLRSLAERCDVAAFLRFARAPYWNESGEHGVLIGDLRYDRSEDVEFAEIPLDATVPRCPPRVPGWTPPRRDLLDHLRLD